MDDGPEKPITNPLEDQLRSLIQEGEQSNIKIVPQGAIEFLTPILTRVVENALSKPTE